MGKPPILKYCVANRSPIATGAKAHLRLEQDLREGGLRRCPVIRSAAHAAEFFGALKHLDREVLIAAALDSKCRMTFWSLLAVGSSSRLTMRVGDAFRGAIRCSANAVLLIHNHPSGSLTPSREDIRLTHDVARAGDLLGYPLLDHVIVSERGYRGLMRRGRTIPFGRHAEREVAQQHRAAQSQ